MMTTMDEVNSDKTEVPDKFMFRSIFPDCSIAERDELSDSQSM